MLRGLLVLSLMASAFGAVAAEPAAQRQEMFLALVKQRHLPPVTRSTWAENVGRDAIWVGRGLRVVGRAEVEGLQIDTGKRVEILDFVARDYGDAAVLTYIVVEHQPQGQGAVTTRLRKMDTYLSREGRWQLVANAEVVGRPDRQPVAVAVAVLDRYSGTYASEFNGKIIKTRIWREGTRLLAQTEGQEKGELLPLSDTLFFDAAQPEEGGPENQFVVGGDGRSVDWIYRDGEVEVRSRRLPDRP
jgi:hypothetical protein